jgi:hypothetical protein
VWKEGQSPEKVDWLGQKLQIDAAKAAGVKRVVLVGSMGGTDPSNMLNKLVGEDGGNILQWKVRGREEMVVWAGGTTARDGRRRERGAASGGAPAGSRARGPLNPHPHPHPPHPHPRPRPQRRAEQYLIASGLEYTIIHPGGARMGRTGGCGGRRRVCAGASARLEAAALTRAPRRLACPGLVDEEGGKRRLVVAVDDKLLERKVCVGGGWGAWRVGATPTRPCPPTSSRLQAPSLARPPFTSKRPPPRAPARPQVRSIPRADVAALAVGCLGLPAAANRAFDVCADPAGEGAPSADWGALLATLGGANCDYTINSQAGAPAARVAA